MANTEKDNLNAEKEAAKAAKKAKQERIKQSKPKKEGTVFSRAGKSVKKFWKDFTGTVKKIVWPGRTQVLKSSAVVLASIVVVGLVIFGFDRGLNALFSVGEDLAENLGAAYSTTEAAKDDKEDDKEDDKDKDDEKDEDEKDKEETKGESDADETESDAEGTEEENTDEETEGEASDED